MRSKRQTTREKLERERKLQERRELKREKKQAAAAARRLGYENGSTPTPDVVAPTDD